MILVFYRNEITKNAQSLKYEGGKVWEKYIMGVHNQEYQD